MRIIDERNKQICLPSEEDYRFFAQIWFSMVHRNSLDSHRVRCMNSFNILRELSELLIKPERQGIYDDIKSVAKEALQIIERENSFLHDYSKHLKRLKPLIEQTAGIDPKKDIDKKELVTYYLKDMLSEMRASYKIKLLNALEKALFEKPSQEQIYPLTGMLLSHLVDSGYCLEGLFGLVSNIFLKADGRCFREKWNTARNIIEQTESEFDIIFRLEGGYQNNLIPPELMGVEFTDTLPIEPPTEPETAFLSKGQGITFAHLRVFAPDDRSAGVQAKRILDDVLDLMRFEWERDVVSVSQEFISRRAKKGKARIFRLPSHIPNPNKNVTRDQFMRFVQRYNKVLSNKHLMTESQERIKSALRFYRMGRDTEQFENKILNWWTGLEYLTRSESGKIVEQVISKLVPAMVLAYPSKHLTSMRNTLLFLRVDSTYKEMSNLEFVKLLQNPVEYQKIIGSLPSQVALVSQLKYLKDQMQDCSMILSFLERHQQNLKWHLRRIWRVRCDIVHSADYTMNLTLLCANLEFYLKSQIGMVLNYIHSNSMIQSLEELYSRLNHDYDFLMKALKDNSHDAYEQILDYGIG